MQETKRPSKEMQVSIARQLGLQPTTVGNFFMNARRRLAHEKYEMEAAQAEAAKMAEQQAKAEEAATAAALQDHECADLDQIELDQHQPGG